MSRPSPLWSRVWGLSAGAACFSLGACGPPSVIEADSVAADSSDTDSGPGTDTDSGPGTEVGSDTDNEAGSEESGGAEVCGDGVLDGVEECDDGNDDEGDGCLSTCVVARTCSQILDQLPAASDGVYTIDPDGVDDQDPFAAYCDMSEDGGGWTLVAKVHRFHGGEAYAEPRGWFAQERDTETLLDTISYEDRPAALASHGQARLAAALDHVLVARVRLIAEDDPNQTATWFKGVDVDAFAWFSDQDHAPTDVCSDPELTLDCDSGQILATGWTPLGGMSLADYGYTAGCGVHMRMDGDDNGDLYSALCSCTDDSDNNAWNDDAIDSHWGNGLEIWFR